MPAHVDQLVQQHQAQFVLAQKREQTLGEYDRRRQNAARRGADVSRCNLDDDRLTDTGFFPALPEKFADCGIGSRGPCCAAPSQPNMQPNHPQRQNQRNGQPDQRGDAPLPNANHPSRTIGREILIIVGDHIHGCGAVFSEQCAGVGGCINITRATLSVRANFRTHVAVLIRNQEILHVMEPGWFAMRQDRVKAP